jgi:hypothetical protein
MAKMGFEMCFMNSVLVTPRLATIRPGKEEPFSYEASLRAESEIAGSEARSGFRDP